MKEFLDLENNNTLTLGSKNYSVKNWDVYHPNGKHMFTTGDRKAKWYLNKGLAIKLNKSSIKLTFIPKGDGFDENEIFGKHARKHQCVVTGTNKSLQRHHIIPYCYRTHFPHEFKNKNHHDVVLINHKQHSKYELLANEFKDKIADMYGVKTISELNTKYSIKLRELGRDYSIILSRLKSLFTSYHTLPIKRKYKQISIISKLTKIPYKTLITSNYIQLYKLYLLIKEKGEYEINEFKTNYKHNYDHGYQVVKKLDSDEKITKFIKLWREHFIETMNPSYMPIGWSIDFRVKRKL